MTATIAAPVTEAWPRPGDYVVIDHAPHTNSLWDVTGADQGQAVERAYAGALVWSRSGTYVPRWLRITRRDLPGAPVTYMTARWAVCPVCGRTQEATADGEKVPHHFELGTGNTTCRGSGMSIEEAWAS